MERIKAYAFVELSSCMYYFNLYYALCQGKMYIQVNFDRKLFIWRKEAASCDAQDAAFRMIAIRV